MLTHGVGEVTTTTHTQTHTYVYTPTKKKKKNGRLDTRIISSFISKVLKTVVTEFIPTELYYRLVGRTRASIGWSHVV